MRGDPGLRGMDGLTGERGEQGEKGDEGAPGIQGIKGDKGEPIIGPAPIVSQKGYFYTAYDPHVICYEILIS